MLLGGWWELNGRHNESRVPHDDRAVEKSLLLSSWHSTIFVFSLLKHIFTLGARPHMSQKSGRVEVAAATLLCVAAAAILIFASSTSTSEGLAACTRTHLLLAALAGERGVWRGRGVIEVQLLLVYLMLQVTCVNVLQHAVHFPERGVEIAK